MQNNTNQPSQKPRLKASRENLFIKSQPILDDQIENKTPFKKSSKKDGDLQKSNRSSKLSSAKKRGEDSNEDIRAKGNSSRKSRKSEKVSKDLSPSKSPPPKRQRIMRKLHVVDPNQNKITDYFIKKDGVGQNIKRQNCKENQPQRNEERKTQQTQQEMSKKENESFVWYQNENQEKQVEKQAEKQGKMRKNRKHKSVKNRVLNRIQQQNGQQNEPEIKIIYEEQLKEQEKNQNHMRNLLLNDNIQNVVQPPNYTDCFSNQKQTKPNKNRKQINDSIRKRQQRQSQIFNSVSSNNGSAAKSSKTIPLNYSQTKFTEKIQEKLLKLLRQRREKFLQKQDKKSIYVKNLHDWIPDMRTLEVRERKDFTSQAGKVTIRKGKIEFHPSQEMQSLRIKYKNNQPITRNITSVLLRVSQVYKLKGKSSFESGSMTEAEKYEKLVTQKQKLLKYTRLNLSQQQCIMQTMEWKVNQYIHPIVMIGYGGFSEVYKCFNSKLSKHVVLKVLYCRSTNHHMQQKYREYMEKEFDIQVKLSHPNIVKVYQKINLPKDNTFAILQEFCKGPQLSQLLNMVGYFREDQAKDIIRQILLGLSYLHSKNIIHYDIKPRNIIFDGDLVKIIDFGLSKQMSQQQQQMQLTTTGMGTFYYLPPEVSDPESPISIKVDIFSVGVLFYELLYGYKPFGHKRMQQEALKIIQNRSTCQVVFPKDFANKVSDEAKMFITRCLKYNPRMRYSANEALMSIYMRSEDVGSPVKR